MNAFYKSLNSAEQSFVDEKTISATYKIKRWLYLLAKAGKYDEIVEAEAKKWARFANICLTLLILSVIITVFSLSERDFFVFGLPTSMLFLVAAILMIRKNRAIKVKDINDYMRKFFMPVLSILKDKAGEEAKLAASLDFRIPREAIQPQIGQVGIRNVKSYSPNYIRSKVQLKDGAILEFSVADQIHDFSWYKTNARKKRKYKNKTKFIHLCLIKMTLPKTAYQVKGVVDESVLVDSHNGSYIAKHKIKLKKTGRDNMFNVALFFKGIQAIYSQFETLNNPQKRREDIDDDAEEIEVYDDRVDIADVAVAAMWMNTDFDDYDYDSFDYAEGSDFSMDDDSATVFDS